MENDIKIEDERYPDSTLIVRDIKVEMEKAFLDYSMSVIVSRALPDVRDGLKPVHRRILYTMHERSNDPSHPYRKSADTVGAVLGAYHPHGDASVYDAMVRLAQDFSLRYPLVDGQGNFGSVDGDPPAAYRYTEARMSKMAVQLMTNIDKNTVPFVPNFDETKQEPAVLPARFPNLLVNGSTGIAVGMATNIPPHNLSEVVEGVIQLIDNPEMEFSELMTYIKGPDFPTGGTIMGFGGIKAAYATGRGKIALRSKIDIIEKKNGRQELIVTEIPYMVNKARVLQDIDRLCKEKRITGISDISDQTNRNGMRVVIELKKDANAQIVLNQLYHMTQLQDTVGVIMLALDNGEPKVMTLKEMLQKYADFQYDIIYKRTAFDLKKAQDRAHILEGLRRAIDVVDEVIATIRATKGGQSEARRAIMEAFEFDEIQANAIVAFRLGQLAGLEIEKIETEYAELTKKITEFTNILSDKDEIFNIVKKELIEIRDKFGDDRRTDIMAVSGEVDIEELIPEYNCVYTLTHAGYIKRMPISVYQTQNRGGRGVNALSRKEEDFVEELVVASSHDYLLFTTNLGRVYRLKGYQIGETGRASKGANIVNLLALQAGEVVTNMLCMDPDNKEGFITIITKNGIVKRSTLASFKNIRKAGLNAIRLDDDDALAWAQITSGENELIVATKNGLAMRFKESDARPTGRAARGVKAIRLQSDDYVVGVGVVRENSALMTVSEDGKGRKTPLSEYRLQYRGGKGVINYKKDKVAVVKVINDDQDIILISLEGVIIRMHASDVNMQSRYGSGVRVMRLGENDKVVMMAVTEREEEEEVQQDIQEEATQATDL